MAKLSSEDLAKPFYSSMSNKYPNRASRFLEKVGNQEPFKLVRGEEGIVLGDASPNSDFMRKVERIASGEQGIKFQTADKVAVRCKDGSEQVIGISGFVKTPALKRKTSLLRQKRISYVQH